MIGILTSARRQHETLKVSRHTSILFHLLSVPPLAAPTPLDLSRTIEDLYPFSTIPDWFDDASLRQHALACRLLERVDVQLPTVRYRGFRPDPAAVGVASTAALPTGTSSYVGAGVSNAASAAWRLEQRREFLPFEERVKRMSIVRVIGEVAVGSTMDSAGVATAEGVVRSGSKTAASMPTVGEDAARGISTNTADAFGDRNSSTDGGRDASRAGEKSGSKAFFSAATSGGGSSAGAGAAKRLPIVLADYLGDTSTIGMAVVDQPGTGTTTALLGFLEWYCRGEAAGGRQVRSSYKNTVR